MSGHQIRKICFSEGLGVGVVKLRSLQQQQKKQERVVDVVSINANQH
jgi:hypothetical protein